jgi:hypothetical protein
MGPVGADAVGADGDVADRHALLAEREAGDVAARRSVAEEQSRPILLAAAVLQPEQWQADLHAHHAATEARADIAAPALLIRAAEQARPARLERVVARSEGRLAFAVVERAQCGAHRRARDRRQDGVQRHLGTVERCDAGDADAGGIGCIRRVLGVADIASAARSGCRPRRWSWRRRRGRIGRNRWDR